MLQQILSAWGSLVLYLGISTLLVAFVWPAGLLAIGLGMIFGFVTFGFFELILMQPTQDSISSLQDAVIFSIAYFGVIAVVLGSSLFFNWELLQPQNVIDYYFIGWCFFGAELLSIIRWVVSRRRLLRHDYKGYESHEGYQLK